MAKAKTVKKKKKTVKPKQEVVAPEFERNHPPPEELSEEQMAQLMIDLDNFQNTFLTRLAWSDKFEIVPTADDEGNILSQEQLSLIKRELNRLGLVTIYAFDIGTRFTAFMCPSKDRKFKIGLISNGAEVH